MRRLREPTDGGPWTTDVALTHREEESELALLAQFMRHDLVASLANAIAERSGERSRRRPDRRSGPRPNAASDS